MAMPRRVWRAGAECDQAASLGRLRIFKLAKRGGFELVNEVVGITRKTAGKVPRPADGVGAWSSGVGGDAVLTASCPVTLERFKAWRCGLMRVRV